MLVERDVFHYLLIFDVLVFGCTSAYDIERAGHHMFVSVSILCHCNKAPCSWWFALAGAPQTNKVLEIT